MSVKWHFALVLLSTFLCIQNLLAQGTFPVQVVPQVLPPAPIYLSDYADANSVNSPLRVQLILNDFTIPSREVRLRISFEGNGLDFQGNDLVNGAEPLFLEGGTPLTLTNVQLAPYLSFENISGISPNAYGQPIPEGAYRFCFEVFDALTGNRLSQRSCATVAVFQNDPPFLLLPSNKSQVEERNPQNIAFQWTPRHINVTNVEYELSIVEIWDNQVDPQQAFLSSTPVFQITTASTTYVYGPADPQLLSDRNYAWRVQAKAKQGAEDIGLFTNQGYSEIFSFSFTEKCDLPSNIDHEVKGSTNANILWEDFTTAIPEFTVRYRQKSPAQPPPEGGGDREGAAWFHAKTTANYVTLWDLKPGTNYEYQVSKKCALIESEWSTTEEFTTFIADDEASLYECGISPDFSLDNTEPLPTMAPGDKFTAGDFPVTITEVSGSNGRFTGKGYVTIPYLNSIKVGVEFTNVLINTDNQLAEGTVKTVYDSDAGNILDVDDVVDTVGDVVGSFGDLYDSLLDLLNDFQGTSEEIEALQNSNNEYEELLGDLLANPYLDEAIKNQLSEDFETYQNASNGLIDTASQGGPNSDGYDTGGVTAALNNFNETTKIAEESLDANSNLEITFETDDLIEIGEVLDANIWYVSPAGVPVSPPKDAILSFYKIRKNPITAYGALASFTITEGPEKGIYRGYRKANQFTGYKRSKDEAPYKFLKNPNPENAVVRTIDDGLGCGAHLYFEGTITSANTNETGAGELVLSWKVNGSWNLLTIDQQTNNSTCLSKINYDDFKNYHLGFYNFYGNGGFLRQVSSNEGPQYIYTIADGENGLIQHYQFNKGSGLWQSTLEPTYDVRTAEALKYLFGQIFSSEAGHFLLDVAGMAPVAGEVFDVLNGAWYAWEGNKTDAAISFASTIPLVYLTTAKNVGKVIKLSDGSLSVIKFSERATKEFADNVKKLDLDTDSFKLLEGDMADEAFAKAIADNPSLISSWKVLEDIGANQTIRKNANYLENIASYFAKYPNRTRIDLVSTASQFDNVEDYLNIIPDINQNSLVKGIRFDHFSNPSVTNYGSFGKAEYSFYLWKNNKWDELEDFFVTNNLNGGWPPNEGFISITKTETVTQLVGKKFDRFQGPGGINGSFASPIYNSEEIGDLYFTYDSRALKYDIKEGTQYVVFQIKSTAPSNLKFDYGDVIPWFGKKGLGDQVKSSIKFDDIEAHLEIIETKTFTNGQWQ